MEQRQEPQTGRQELRETLDTLTRADVVNLKTQLENIARLERVEGATIRLEDGLSDIRKLLVGNGAVGALEELRGLREWRNNHQLRHEKGEARWNQISGGAIDTLIKAGIGLLLGLIGAGLLAQFAQRGGP